MNHINYHIPIDKTVIKTRLEFHPDFLSSPKNYVRDKDIPARSVRDCPSKFSGRPKDHLSFRCFDYKGVIIEASKHPREQIFDTTITFNPGVCLHGHNGRTITLTEFLHALALLTNHLKPLLRDQNQWVDLIPGLRRNGVAYWHSLEVPLHVIDPDGMIMARLQNTSHQTLQKIRPWQTSIKMGAYNSEYQLVIYNKAIQMVASRKLGKLPALDSQRNQLRFELRLKNEKLLELVGNSENVDIIDNRPRLVRFLPADLIKAHRECFGQLNGFFKNHKELPIRQATNPDAALGVTLARLATDERCKLGLPEIFRQLKFYRPASGRALAPVRQEAYVETSRLSGVESADFLSDRSYSMGYSITNPALENKISYPLEDFYVPPEIRASYCPRDLRFHPITPFPHYFRL